MVALQSCQRRQGIVRSMSCAVRSCRKKVHGAQLHSVVTGYRFRDRVVHFIKNLQWIVRVHGIGLPPSLMLLRRLCWTWRCGSCAPAVFGSTICPCVCDASCIHSTVGCVTDASAHLVLHSVQRFGCVVSHHHCSVVLFLCLSAKDSMVPSCIHLGPIHPFRWEARPVL